MQQLDWKRMYDELLEAYGDSYSCTDSSTNSRTAMQQPDWKDMYDELLLARRDYSKPRGGGSVHSSSPYSGRGGGKGKGSGKGSDMGKDIGKDMGKGSDTGKDDKGKDAGKGDEDALKALSADTPNV
jgi:hypothetical protein